MTIEPRTHEELNALAKRMCEANDKMEAKSGGDGSTRTQPYHFTCHRCRMVAVCESAYDLYNTGGDCLEDK